MPYPLHRYRVTFHGLTSQRQRLLRHPRTRRQWYTHFRLLQNPRNPCVQADPIAATVDTLAKANATFKAGLEALLANPKSSEPCAPELDAAKSRAEQCKFCGSTAHFEEEADKYVFARKCKRDVFGRLTLPSGAEAPRHIKGKCLGERFEE
jgi:hypothetical protein